MRYIPQVRFFQILTLPPQSSISLCSIFFTILHPFLQFSRYKASQTTNFIINSASDHHYSQHKTTFFANFIIKLNFFCQYLLEIDCVNGWMSLPHTTRGTQILGKRKFWTPPPPKSSKSVSFSILKPFTILFTQAKDLTWNSFTVLIMRYNPYRILCNRIKQQYNAIG
jgi:hypothetical protein